MPRESTPALLKAFEVWAGAAGDAVDLDVAELLVDLKADFGVSPDPRRWDDGEVGTLLLAVLPRKMLLQDAPAETTLPTLRAFLRFLDGSNRMHRRSAGLTALLAEVDDAAGSYAAAMVDPQRAGLAKTMVSAMLADGVDVTDPVAVQRWQEEFNARSHEERIALTGGAAPGWAGDAPAAGSPFDGPEPATTEAPALPMVRLAPRADLAQAARTCATLQDAHRMVDWVGERRTITGTGALRLEDARQAAIDLDLDAPLPRDLHSAWELPRLAEVWQVALLTEMLESSATRVYPGPQRRILLDGDDHSVLEAWGTAFDAVVANTGVEGVTDDVADAADHVVPMLLVAPYTAGGPVPLPELSDLMREIILEELGAGSPPSSTVDFVVGQLPRMLGSWERMGSVQVTDDELALTALGVFGAQRILSEVGFDAPVMGDPAEMSATELLGVLGELAEGDVDAAAEAWLAEREPVEAASQLLGAARDCEALERGLAFHLLEVVGEPAAEVVRDGLAGPVRPYAAVWLQARGHEVSLTAQDMQWMLVDVCSGLLDAGEAAGLVDQVAQLGTAEEQVDMLGEAWRSGHPRAAEVLDAIGREHPASKVAKAARKGAFKARSVG